MATNTPPAPPAPSAKSIAQPISPADLARELGPKTPANVTRAEPPPTPKDAPVDKPRPVTSDDAPPKPLAGFRDKVMAKPPEETKPKTEPAAKADPVAKTETPKAEPAPKTETPAVDEVPEDHRRVLPHDKPDTAKRIKAILAEKDALKKEIETLKSQPKTVENTEELTKLRDEHKRLSEEATRYRRRYDWEKDPEVTEKYRAPIKASETTINETLKRHGFTDATLKIIDEAGGFAEFSRGRQLFPVNVPDPENPGQTKLEHRSAADLARSWLAGIPVADAEAIKASLGHQQLLRAEEQAARTKAEAEANQFYESREATTRKAQEEAKATQERMAKEYEAWLGETETKTEFLRDREIPDNADEAQRKSVEEYNAFAKQLRDGLRKHPTTPQDYQQLKLDAAEAHHLRRLSGEKDARIAALEAQLSKSRAAVKTTPAGGSLMKNTRPQETAQPKTAPTDWKAGLRSSMQSATGNADDE